MRGFGGVRLIGLAACLLGCATVPPDPGREPPPAQMEPMPPPEPAGAHPPAAAAGEAETVELQPVLEWDAGTRTIHCGETVALPIPAGLTVYERQDEGDELIVTPPGSPPGGALIVIDIGVKKRSFDMGDPKFEAKLKVLSERMDRIGKRMRAAAERLLAMVSGPWSRQAIGDLQADLRTDDGVVDAALTLDDPPGAIWRFVGTNAGSCVFMALELVRPDAGSGSRRC